MAKEQVMDIAELQQDTKNFNVGTEEGRALIEKSFSELGAGRSILVDRNNNIIAGNKSQLGAIAAGIKKVRVIETTGDELIAVKRVDVDLDSEQGRKLALADNATAQANLSWDETQLQAVADEFEGFDVSEWGVDSMPELDLDLEELTESAMSRGVSNILGTFTVTFAFPDETKEAIKGYIKKHTKQDLEKKIIEICQTAVHR